MPKVDVRLDTTNLDRLIKELPRRRNKALLRVGAAARDGAQARARIRTAAMAASLYLSMTGSSDYAFHAALGSTLNPEAAADGMVDGEVKPTTVYEIVVGDPMGYSGFNEYGTTRMAAKPFLGPGGTENAVKAFPDAVAEMFTL